MASSFTSVASSFTPVVSSFTSVASSFSSGGVGGGGGVLLRRISPDKSGKLKILFLI